MVFVMLLIVRAPRRALGVVIHDHHVLESVMGPSDHVWGPGGDLLLLLNGFLLRSWLAGAGVDLKTLALVEIVILRDLGSSLLIQRVLVMVNCIPTR
jgi:hypothetical protein